MIEVLFFLLVVALAAALVALVVLTSRTITRQSSLFVAHLHRSAVDARAERELLLQAVLARTAAEFGQLNRIRQQEQSAATAGGPNRSLTPEQYAAWLENDLRGMGYEPDADIPLVPEGLGG